MTDNKIFDTVYKEYRVYSADCYSGQGAWLTSLYPATVTRGEAPYDKFIYVSYYDQNEGKYVEWITDCIHKDYENNCYWYEAAENERTLRNARQREIELPNKILVLVPYVMDEDISLDLDEE